MATISANLRQEDTQDSNGQKELARQISEMGEWFHNINLNGVWTAPHHFLGDFPNVKWKHIAPALPADLSGATVLDIGCNGGFHSIELKKRGASRVLGVDVDDRYLDQARFASQVLGLEIEFAKCSVYDVDSIPGQFDFVLFMGVFYHLRYPLYALDKVIKAGDARRFGQVYNDLTNACNACHTYMEHPFLVIKLPQSGDSLYPDQDFSTAREP